MHIKSRKIIFFTVAFIIIYFTLSNRAARSQAGMSLTIDKEYYYVGDVIKIHYTFPKRDPKSKVYDTYSLGYTSVAIKASLGNHIKRSEANGLINVFMEIQTEKGGKRDWGPYGRMMLGSRTAADITLTLTRKVGKTVTNEIKKYFRLRQPKFSPIPGALTLPKGNRFNSYDLPDVNLNLPSSIKDVTTFSVDVHYLPEETRGKAINFKSGSYDKYIIASSGPIVSHAQKLTFKNLKGKMLYTGIYEIRLKQQIDEYSSGKYIVDSIRFEVVNDRWSKTIRVLSPEHLNVNEPITVRINGTALPFKDDDYAYYSGRLCLSKVVEENAEIFAGFDDDIIEDDVHLKNIDCQQITAPDQEIVFKPVKWAGKYIFSIEERGVIWDSLEVNVMGRLKRDDPLEMDERTKEMFKAAGAVPPTDPSYIQIGDKVRYIYGEKIPIEIYSNSEFYGKEGILKAVLHKGSFSYDTDLGDLIKEWDVVRGKKIAWTISETLPVGEYRLLLKEVLKDKSERTAIHPRHFQIIPRFGEAKIDLRNKEEFLSGEAMKMDFILPRSLKQDDFKFSYNIIKKGGFLPGCARVKDSIYMSTHSYLENGLKNVTIRAPDPGHYLIQFIAMPTYPGSSNNGTFLLAETFFNTDIKWAEGGLLFPSGKDEFVYEENIPVTINVRLDGGLSSFDIDPEKYVLEIFRQGDVTYGGAYRYSESIWLPSKALVNDKYSPENSPTIIVKGNDKVVLNVEKVKEYLPPGGYEFRLFTHYEGFLIARLPFKILEPDSPFPFERGNPDLPRPSNIESPRHFQTLKIGEFLDKDSCSTLLKKEVESMALTFVKWDEENKKYIVIKGALEFGQSFYIEGKLEKEASSNFYAAEIKGPSGRMQEVILWTDEDDNTVVRSERLYMIWEDTGAGE